MPKAFQKCSKCNYSFLSLFFHPFISTKLNRYLIKECTLRLGHTQQHQHYSTQHTRRALKTHSHKMHYINSFFDIPECTLIETCSDGLKRAEEKNNPANTILEYRQTNMAYCIEESVSRYKKKKTTQLGDITKETAKMHKFQSTKMVQDESEKKTKSGERIEYMHWRHGRFEIMIRARFRFHAAELSFHERFLGLPALSLFLPPPPPDKMCVRNCNAL